MSSDQYSFMQTPIPVFLPGNNRDWSEVAGVATISEDGEIVIKLHSKEAAQHLIKLSLDKVIYAVSFDYYITSKKE